MRARRDSIFGFDLIILVATLVLLVIGILFIYSSGRTSTGVIFSREYVSQIIWSLTGIALMLVMTLIDYSLFRSLAPYIYGLLCVLLVVTLVVGKRVHGARSWLGLGGLGIQPSEFAKIGAVVMLARYLSGIGKAIQDLHRLILAFGIVLVPVALILIQPDMGTALVFVPIFLFMTYLAGAKPRHLLFLLATGGLTVVLLILPAYERFILGRELPFFTVFTNFSVMKYILLSFAGIVLMSFLGHRFFGNRYFYWIMYGGSICFAAVLGSIAAYRFLRDYQIMRLVIFLEPQVEPLGSGWNIIQSQTAVGSGGFIGKGFLNGTQSHLQYLPQQSTDFIFSILAEEWGFVGGLAVFVLFGLIIARGIRISYLAKDEFGLYLGIGIVAMIFYHVAINIGMAIGVMPVTGIPLFFLSYGGSSAWTALIGLGILESIYMRRY